MELIYVTGLINNDTDEEIYVMVDPDTGRKFLSSNKDTYVPFFDEELLDVLNNDEIYFKKPSFKKVIVIEGVVCTVILTTMGALTLKEAIDKSNMSFVLKREVPGYIAPNNIDYDNIDNFIDEYFRNVDINEFYSGEEKDILKYGGEDFLKDWGYLYTKEQKEDLLYGIRRNRVERESEFDSDRIAGSYYEGLIKIGDTNSPLTTTHEVIHGMLKHSSRLKRKLSFGFCRSIDEAVTTTINKHYFEEYVNGYTEDAYNYQMSSLFKLSLIIDDTEAIMRSQLLQEGDVIDLIEEACPSMPKKDITRYFHMLDLRTRSAVYDKYTLEENFDNEMEKLYKEMYKSKYDIDLPDDLVITSQDFLSDSVSFYRRNYPCIYTVPRELFNGMITSNNKIDESFLTGYVAGSVEPLLLLCTQKEKDEFVDNQDSIDFLYDKYSDNEEDLDKFVRCLILNDEDFTSYFELYIDFLNKRDLSPTQFSTQLNEGLNTFFECCIRDEAVKKIVIPENTTAEDAYRATHYEELETILKEKTNADIVFDFYLNFDSNLRLNSDEKEISINTQK